MSRQEAESKMFAIRTLLQDVRTAAVNSVENVDPRHTFVNGNDRNTMVNIANESLEMQRWFEQWGDYLLQVTEMTGDEEEDGVYELVNSVGALVYTSGVNTCMLLLESFDNEVKRNQGKQQQILARMGVPTATRIREHAAREKKKELAAKGVCFILTRLCK